MGREVVDRLLARGHQVKALVRSASHFPLARQERLELVKGDALEPETLGNAMSGCDAAVNLIGILREKRLRGITYERMHVIAVQNLLNEAEHAGIEHFIQMSAKGVRVDGVSRYQTTKHEAEIEIQRRIRHWTIFRPDIIIGPGRGFISEIAPLALLPFSPVIGDGKYVFEPVDRRVVAEAFVTAVERDSIGGAVYELRGPQAYTFNEILDLLGRALGRRKVRKLHLPLWFVRAMVSAFGRLPFSPVNRDQLEMLVESGVGKEPNGVNELGLQKIFLQDQLEYAIGKTRKENE